MKDKIAGVSTEIMLDSGSSVSLLRQEIVLGLKGITRRRPPQNFNIVHIGSDSPLAVTNFSSTMLKLLWCWETLR